MIKAWLHFVQRMQPGFNHLVIEVNRRENNLLIEEGAAS